MPGLSILLYVSLAIGARGGLSQSAMPVGAKVTVSKEKPGSYIDLAHLILIIDKRQKIRKLAERRHTRVRHEYGSRITRSDRLVV
jgi:hypothetical protein